MQPQGAPLSFERMDEVVAMDAVVDIEFTQFMHSRWAQLVRLGYGLTADQILAEDLAQTTLAIAYASWPRVRRSGNPDAYVRRAMIKASHGRFRRCRVAEQLTDQPPEAAMADPTDLRDDRSELISALMMLPYGQRAVVVLRYWMEMTEAETAAALGCSIDSVKSQASRALARLRMTTELGRRARTSEDITDEH